MDIKSLSELLQQIGIPAFIILYYIYKDWKQSDKILKSMESMVSTAKELVTSNAKIIEVATQTKEVMTEMKVRLELLERGQNG